MPKRKLSEVTSDTTRETLSSQRPKLTEEEYQHLKLQTTRLKQKFEFGVTSLSRALKAARGFERQKLGRRQKTAKGGPAAENALAHAKGKGKAKNKGNVSPEETARRIEGEIQVLKTLDPVTTAEKYLFKQLAKNKRIAESPVFYRFRQSKEKKIKLEGPKSTEEANVTARLFKSNPVQNVLPGIMEGLRGLFGLEGAAAPKGKNEKGEKGKKEDSGSGKAKTSTSTKTQSVEDISGDESESGSEGGVPVPIARGAHSDEDMDMEDAESGEEEDYSRFDALLGSDSGSEDDEGDDDAASPTHPRRSMSISLSPSPPPKKAKSTATSKTPATSTTFLPSLMMGGYWSGSESEAEEIEEAPKRKNRMGQQARRALWEKKYGAAANHVKQEQVKGKKGKGGRDSGWDMRKGATGDGDHGRRKWGTGSNSMPMSGKDRLGGAGAGAGGKEGGKPKKPQDDKPLHPSWEAARKAKEAKATAAFAGKKVVFD
ncbi:Bud-site selection protein [Aspergillus multicolor]|uniref:BUD22 family protein n=1 Tax=Aspergillus multicolor TaxID=41759 RepID=UPI003CCDABAC